MKVKWKYNFHPSVSISLHPLYSFVHTAILPGFVKLDLHRRSSFWAFVFILPFNLQNGTRAVEHGTWKSMKLTWNVKNQECFFVQLHWTAPGVYGSHGEMGSQTNAVPLCVEPVPAGAVDYEPILPYFGRMGEYRHWGYCVQCPSATAKTVKAIL